MFSVCSHDIVLYSMCCMIVFTATHSLTIHTALSATLSTVVLFIIIINHKIINCSDSEKY